MMDRMQYARIKHHSYAAFLYSKEKWITLENGTHVQIDGEGNITGGPSALKGKGITNLSHFGNKSSTDVDKTKSSADTADVSNSSTKQQGKPMKTLTIKGTTFKAANKLKEMGFTFNPSAKTWTMNAEPGRSKYDQEGFFDSKGNFIGSEESILHAVKVHAKAHDLTLTTADHAEPKKTDDAETKTESKPATESKLLKRRNTRDAHYQVGMSLTNPDGSHLVVTKVDRPYQDDHGFWIHGISTRPATEEEIPQIQERRAKQAQEKAEHSAHLQRMHGGEMR